MTSRSHLSFQLYQSDRNVLLPWASVRVYEADGATPFTGTIYRAATGALTFLNPFVVAPALLDLWFDTPVRIVLGVQADRSAIETLTPVLDATPDADELIFTASPLMVDGTMVANGLLRAQDTVTGYWFQPGLSPHDHHATAPNSTRVGPRNPVESAVANFPGTTSIGAEDPAYAPVNNTPDQTAATMIGYSAYALGRQAVALGTQVKALTSDQSPLFPGATAIGFQSVATDGSVSLGREAGSADPTLADGVQVGRSAQSRANRGTALGAYSLGESESVAVGFRAATDVSQAIALGQLVEMIDEALNIDPSLTLTVPGTLLAETDAYLAGRTSQLGFFGVAGTTLPDVGDDEPASGISALDNLIYALRDLGLLRKRNAPLLRYDASLLKLADKAPVASWPDESSSDDLAPSINSHAPAFNKAAPVFNNAPTVTFTASQQITEDHAKPSVTTYVAVAAHGTAPLVSSEGLLTLWPVEPDDVRTTVLQVQSAKKPTAWSPTMSAYDLDGLDQSGNLRVQADGGAHVYRADLVGGWPASTTVIGKPNPYTAGWSGQLAHVLGLDDTWDERQLDSLSTGLAFQYHVGQDDSVLLTPAKNRLASVQNGTGVVLDFDQVPSAARPVQVSGTVTIPSSITIPQIPVISVDTHCRWREFRGPLSGLWRLLDELLHLIEVYVLPTLDTALSDQYRIGRFELDAVGRWSTGGKQCGFGYKVIRPVLKTDFSPVHCHTEPLVQGIDAQVAIYTRVGATRTLQCRVPMRPDNTFFATVPGSGNIEADLVKVTDPTYVYGTSVRPLPQTTSGSNTASIADLALHCLALLNLGRAWHYRVQQNLTRLATLQVSGGLLASSVDVTNPTTATGDPLTSTNALVAIVALRYEKATGDTQFHTLASSLGTGLAARINGAHLIASGASSGTACLTTDAVLAYWAFCLLGDTTHALQLYGTLATTYWNAMLGRFHNGTDATGATPDTVHNLWTDLWTALYCQAVGDDREVLVRKALSLFRLRDKDAASALPLFPSSTLYPSPTLFPSGG